MSEGSIPRSAHARSAWRVAGWAFVGIGTIGALVPLLPTTCFLILALACFTRGSPALAARLLSHSRFGPPLAAWQRSRALSARAKVLAVSGMAVAATVVAAGSDGWMVPVGVGATLLAVACYLVTRPTTRSATPLRDWTRCTIATAPHKATR